MIHLIESKAQMQEFAPLFSESKTALTIDPGLNTGLCFWRDKEIYATKTLRGAGEGLERQFNVSEKVYNNTIGTYFDYIVIEGVEVYTGLKSQTAASRGDLSTLAYLAGMLFVQMASRTSALFIINPSVWKAQLTYKALGVWVNKIIGHEFKTEHELAAVGIGLFCQGRLH